MMETNSIPMMSPTIGKITEALSKFQGAVKQPTFNKKVRVNNNYNFEYADLGACVAAASPVLKENGLAIAQTIQGGVLVTTLMHTSGEFINSVMPYDLSRFTKMQDLGSALTYAKRYSYCAILGLVADADDDANTADGNSAQFQNRGQQQQATVTGADLKKAIAQINATQSANDAIELFHRIKASSPEIADNQSYISALTEKCSGFGIQQLALCNNLEEIQMLEDEWRAVWPAIIAPKTTFGNAIEKRKKEVAE